MKLAFVMSNVKQFIFLTHAEYAKYINMKMKTFVKFGNLKRHIFQFFYSLIIEVGLMYLYNTFIQIEMYNRLLYFILTH